MKSKLLRILPTISVILALQGFSFARHVPVSLDVTNADRSQDKNLKPYMIDIRRRIQSNWHPQLHVDRKAKVFLQIRPDGNLGQLQLQESSGDPIFDQASMQAVQRTAPFPQPPIGGIRFLNIVAGFDGEYAEDKGGLDAQQRARGGAGSAPFVPPYQPQQTNQYQQIWHGPQSYANQGPYQQQPPQGYGSFNQPQYYGNSSEQPASPNNGAFQYPPATNATNQQMERAPSASSNDEPRTEPNEVASKEETASASGSGTYSFRPLTSHDANRLSEEARADYDGRLEAWESASPEERFRIQLKAPGGTKLLSTQKNSAPKKPAKTHR